MKKHIFLIMAFMSALLLTACGSSGNSSSSGSEHTEKITEATTEPINTDFKKTIGFWTYGNEIFYHSQNGNRYLLTKDSAGTIKDSEGNAYSIQECDYKLYTIINLSDDAMSVKEGRYYPEFLGSRDYPDGYKTMIISYNKVDLFDADAVESVIQNHNVEAPQTDPSTESETDPSTEPETDPSTEPETDPPTEPETDPPTEPETISPDDNAEYAAIYKDLEDFLETNNFKEKDNNNRALEVFNHLHNVPNSNIDQNSIENDTSKNEVRFKCYDKYLIVINVEKSTIDISELN